MISHALGMVSRRGGNDTSLLLLVRQPRELVQCAALLERPGELQIFELHPDLGASNIRQGLGQAHRRALNLAFEDIGGLTDIFNRDR